MNEACRERRRSIVRKETGQSLVELSFLLLPFLLVSIGVIEIGRAWTIKQSITNAAREGARILILPYGLDRICPGIDCSSATSVQVAAFEATQNYLVNTGVGISPDTTSIELIHEWIDSGGLVQTEALVNDPQPGDYVGVRIRYKFASVVEALFTGSNEILPMTAVGVMRHE